jgi:hypothetical protein
MALSDTAVWQAKATGKASTLSDTDGLSLQRQQKLAFPLLLAHKANS